MQFTDGNRIDLGIYPRTRLHEHVGDSLSVLLLDEDGVVGPLPAPSESDYRPRPPTAKAFADCCNEFWWVCPYVAKGLWREEALYARHMLDQVVRAELMKMLTWHIGVTTQYSRNPGKLGKYFRQYLRPEWWDLLQKTHAGSGVAPAWEALFTLGELFRKAALAVAEHFGFEYPYDDDRRVSAHLRQVRLLPRDAREIY